MCNLVEYQGFKVADIKLDCIKNIVEQAKNTDNIEHIILFGSALESRCKHNSDIDIAIFGKSHKKMFLCSKEFKNFQHRVFAKNMEQDYDFLYFSNQENYSGEIMNEIQNGVTIYRR